MVVVGAATVATYRVGMEVLAPPLAFLFTVGYVAALAGAFALIRKRVDRLEGSRSGKWSGGVIRRERRFGTGRLIAGNRRTSDCRDWHRHINSPSTDVLGRGCPVSERKGRNPSQAWSEISQCRSTCTTFASRTLTSHRANTNKLPIGLQPLVLQKRVLKCGVSPFVVGYRRAIQIRSRK